MEHNTEHPPALQNNGQVVNGHRITKGAINFAPFLYDILYCVDY